MVTERGGVMEHGAAHGDGSLDDGQFLSNGASLATDAARVR